MRVLIHNSSIFVFLFFANIFLAAESPKDSIFSPPEWKFGMIEQGSIARTVVTAENRGGQDVTLTFVPTCDCLGVEPPSCVVPSGGKAIFSLSYDSSDDSGITRKGFIVQTSLSGGKPAYFLVEGVVRIVNVSHGGPWVRHSPGPGGTVAGTTVTLLYYYSPGCGECEVFLSDVIPGLEKELGIRIEIQRKDVFDDEAYRELADFAAASGGAIRTMPVLRAGEVLLQGDVEIRERLPALLKTTASAKLAILPTDAMPAAPAGQDASLRLAFLPVVAAGLIDGINPCAFATLLFLLASLAVAGRGRREILAIGFSFTLGVFLTYMSIGLGFIAILRIASGFSLFWTVLRWILALVLLVFAALSVYDFFLIRAGRPTEILLQLPGSLKDRIHGSIRTRVRMTALVGSSLVLGFFVSVFEFACTGQVYLPTLAYMARAKSGADSFFLLAVYNLSFVVPLAVVFAVSYFGVGSRKIAGFFQASMGWVKLALSFVFVGLALLIAPL